MTNSVMNMIRQIVSNMSMPQAQNSWGQTLNLVGGVPVTLDFKTLANQNSIQNIQGLWVDNSAGTAACVVSVPATLQNFTVPAGYQGVTPLYVSPDLVIIFSGTGAVPVVFTNFPTPVGVWPANTAASGAFTFTGGNLNTRDVNIAAAVDGGAIDTVQKLYTGGDTQVHHRSGNVISGTTAAAGTTVILAGAPSVFLSSAHVSISGGAQVAAPGLVNVRLFFGTSGLTIFNKNVFLGNAAPGVDQAPFQLFSLSNLDYLGALAADNLSITLGTALTVGNLEWTVGAGTTAVA